MDAEEHEHLFLAEPLGPPPTGRFEGHAISWLPASKALHARIADGILFRAMRWGIDFDAGSWWFTGKHRLAGRYAATPGASRWRPGAQVLRLTYERMKAPAALKRFLYDEVKPLPDGRIIGIGGVARGPGQGDHFLFEMTQIV